MRGLDEVLLAVNNAQRAVWVEHADVARLEPALLEVEVLRPTRPRDEIIASKSKRVHQVDTSSQDSCNSPLIRWRHGPRSHHVGWASR